MGQARQRGTYEERQAEAVRLQKANTIRESQEYLEWRKRQAARGVPVGSRRGMMIVAAMLSVSTFR